MSSMIDDNVFRKVWVGAAGPALRGRVLGTVLAILLLVPSALLAQEGTPPVAGDLTIRVPAYVIGKEDVLEVNVWGEPELSGANLPVRPDGMISLPLLGDVLAAGLTPTALAQVLTERYAEHVRTPTVIVAVSEVNSFKVYLLGNVGNQGALNLGRETRLLQVLALGGGFTDFANTKRILIIRQEDDGTQRRMEINYDKIVSGENMEMNLRLKPGDTIVVP